MKNFLIVIVLAISSNAFSQTVIIRPNGSKFESKEFDYSKLDSTRHCYVANEKQPGKHTAYVEGDVYRKLLRCERNKETKQLNWVKL